MTNQPLSVRNTITCTRYSSRLRRCRFVTLRCVLALCVVKTSVQRNTSPNHKLHVQRAACMYIPRHIVQSEWYLNTTGLFCFFFYVVLCNGASTRPNMLDMYPYATYIIRAKRVSNTYLTKKRVVCVCVFVCVYPFNLVLEYIT